MQFPPRETPWGPYTFIREVLPGVWRVATSAHGGFWVTPERLRAMPRVLVEGADGEPPFAPDDARAGWFEEDLEACRVVVAFGYGSDPVPPFPGGVDAVKRALEYLRAFYPKTVAALADWLREAEPVCI